jgi:hypothetical protein
MTSTNLSYSTSKVSLIMFSWKEMTIIHVTNHRYHGAVVLCISFPSTRALLLAAAPSRRPLLSGGNSKRPEPTPVVRWSRELKSLATGGWSGRGRLALVFSISAGLLVFWSMTDYGDHVRGLLHSDI